MKLKQSILLCLSMLFAASCTSDKKVKDSGVMLNDEITGQEFGEIKVSSAIEVTLYKSDTCMVKLEYSEVLKNKIKAEVKEGILVLSIDDVDEADEFFNSKHAHAEIYMPSFDKIHLTRASSLEFADTFNVDKAEIEIEDAAELKKGKLIVGNLNLKMTNASTLKALLYAETLKADVSSACEVDLRAIDDRTGKLFEAEVNKASEFDAEKLPFDVITINGRAASSIKVYPVKNIKADIKSASVLEYKTLSNELVKEIKSTGMSQVEEI